MGSFLGPLRGPLKDRFPRLGFGAWFGVQEVRMSDLGCKD